jgi:regulator of protease activity HflC (stomatin/prohibitin superfamily)
MDSKAYRALQEANLICNKHSVKDFDSIEFIPGTWDITQSMCLQALCCLCLQGCGQLRFLTVEPGCVQIGGHSDGTNLYFGPGVHVLVKIWKNVQGRQQRISEETVVTNGTKAIVIVQQGFVGLAFEKGEPVLLPPGVHQWDNPDLNFDKMIDLASKQITMGPYTLVTVEEGYAAITIDNGKQKILTGGKSYMLTHQNWKFLAWLSCKMQTNKFGPLTMTTGDNITLSIVANVNWMVTDPIVAAGKNVDTTASTDSLKMIRDDVILQVTSSIASLVGAIQYGSQGTAGIQAAGVTGKTYDVDLDAEPEPENKTGRKALWDPDRLATAVSDANSITERYGVHIMSINLISAAPSDTKLVDVMSRGAVAAVAAEETMKEARAAAQALVVAAEAEKETAQAAADAMLIKARSEAEAKKVIAGADALAERIRAQGSMEAGKLMDESEVCVSLAKLKIAYGPFVENQSSTFFFGLSGPGDLPTALLGNSLAAQTGLENLDFGRGGAQGGAAASSSPGWFK